MIKKEHLSEAVICRAGDNCLEVARILRDTQFRHLIVLDETDKPVGVISTVDINNRIVAEEKDAKSLTAKEIMTGNVETIDIEESYDKAYSTMGKLGTYSIPVTKNGKLIGLLEFTQAFRKGEKK